MDELIQQFFNLSTSHAKLVAENEALRAMVENKEGNMNFKVGDKVSKVGGDYRFDGVVVAVFEKLSGAVRLCVEDDRGVLHIYSEKNLKHSEDGTV